MTTQINDNLTRFHEMRNQLDDSSRWHEVGDYLIGALATSVDEPTWDRAVQTAFDCVKEYDPQPTCSHREWQDGHCAEMSCFNYIEKHR